MSYLSGGFKEASIVTQVTNGKNAMPAFGGRLSDEEIEDVAAYVYDQATGDKWEWTSLRLLSANINNLLLYFIDLKFFHLAVIIFFNTNFPYWGRFLNIENIWLIFDFSNLII